MNPPPADDPNPPLRGLVQLEPLVAAHAAEMLPLFADRAHLAYVDHLPPETLAELEARYRRLESRRSPDGSQFYLNWATRVEGSLTGFVELTVTERKALVAYFTARHACGRGYATEATRTALAFVERRFGAATFEATIDHRNEASRRLVRRLGFALVDAADPCNLVYRRG